MVFSATFNNISVVILVKETEVPEENNWPAASHWQTLSHNVVSSTPRHEWGSNSQLPYNATTEKQIEKEVSLIVCCMVHRNVIDICFLGRNGNIKIIRVDLEVDGMNWNGVKCIIYRSDVLEMWVDHNEMNIRYSQTCIKRSPLGSRKSGLLRQVTS